MIAAVLRRLLLVPMCVAVSPLMFVMGWLMSNGDWRDALGFVAFTLRTAWYGDAGPL